MQANESVPITVGTCFWCHGFAHGITPDRVVGSVDKTVVVVVGNIHNKFGEV
jgi:hypothetical protein